MNTYIEIKVESMSLARESNFGGTVRITMLSSCQSGCDFCHLEGHKTSNEIGTLNPAIADWKKSGRLDNAVKGEDIQSAIDIAKALNLDNINLTGGEPSLHPHTPEYIKIMADAGLSVAMTTHAEIYSKKFEEILHSGLEWVIISLHAITPEQYLAMDLVAQQMAKSKSHEEALRYAKMRLDKKFSNIALAVDAQKKGLIKGVITNTVLLNLEQARGIILYCNELGILPRVQRDLNNKRKSQGLLDSLINSLNSTLTKEIQAIGDSSGAGFDYEFQDPISGKKGCFRVKDFGDLYVDEMCNGCAKKDTDFCRERFYGVRIEPGHVRTCIDYDHFNLTNFETQGFIDQVRHEGTVPHAIMKQYENAMITMRKKQDTEVT